VRDIHRIHWIVLRRVFLVNLRNKTHAIGDLFLAADFEALSFFGGGDNDGCVN